VEIIADAESQGINHSQCRPLEEGDAVGIRRLINNNDLSKGNARSLKDTIDELLPETSNFFHQIPNYVNSACVPFLSNTFSMANMD
jgi:hypothetical protein